MTFITPRNAKFLLHAAAKLRAHFGNRQEFAFRNCQQVGNVDGLGHKTATNIADTEFTHSYPFVLLVPNDWSYTLGVNKWVQRLPAPL